MAYDSDGRGQISWLGDTLAYGSDKSGVTWQYRLLLMFSRMPLQIVAAGKGFAAQLAFKRLFTHVNKLVFSQITFLSIDVSPPYASKVSKQA